MKKKATKKEEFDLKHNTMEFAASGDEELEQENVLDLGEDEISAEELEFLDGDDEDIQEAALHEMANDLETDSDYIANDEEWTDDLPDQEEEGEEEED